MLLCSSRITDDLSSGTAYSVFREREQKDSYPNKHWQHCPLIQNSQETGKAKYHSISDKFILIHICQMSLPSSCCPLVLTIQYFWPSVPDALHSTAGAYHLHPNLSFQLYLGHRFEEPRSSQCVTSGESQYGALTIRQRNRRPRTLLATQQSQACPGESVSNIDPLRVRQHIPDTSQSEVYNSHKGRYSY